MAAKRASKTDKASPQDKPSRKKNVGACNPGKPEDKKAAQVSEPISTVSQESFPDQPFIGSSDEQVRDIADSAALREYFNLPSVSELAHRAALQGGAQGDDQTPKSLVKTAAELHSAAETWLYARRKALAGRLSLKALGRAVDMVGAPDLKTDSPAVNSLLACDPVAGPLIERLLEIKQHQGELSYSIDGEPTMAMPFLPCTLNVALRSVTGDKTVPNEVLMQAFRDCLLVSPTRTWSKNDDAEQNSARNWKSFLEGFAPTVDQRNQSDPETVVSNNLLGLFTPHQHSLEQADYFRANFKHGDGDKAPSRVKTEADTSFSSHWQGLRPVDKKDKFLWLADHFRKFWTKHGAVYVKHHKHNQPGAVAKSKKNKEAGIKSVSSKENARWRERTQGFIDFLEVKGQDRSSSDITTLIREYVENDSSSKDPRTKAKQVGFFGTLCNEGTRDLPEIALLRILQESTPKSKRNKDYNPEALKERSRKPKTGPSIGKKCFEHVSYDTINYCKSLLMPTLHKLKL